MSVVHFDGIWTPQILELLVRNPCMFDVTWQTAQGRWWNILECIQRLGTAPPDLNTDY